MHCVLGRRVKMETAKCKQPSNNLPIIFLFCCRFQTSTGRERFGCRWWPRRSRTDRTPTSSWAKTVRTVTTTQSSARSGESSCKRDPRRLRTRWRVSSVITSSTRELLTRLNAAVRRLFIRDEQSVWQRDLAQERKGIDRWALSEIVCYLTTQGIKIVSVCRKP